jgi:hypothetical protein
MVYAGVAGVRTTYFGDLCDLRESKLPFYFVAGVKTTF